MQVGDLNLKKRKGPDPNAWLCVAEWFVGSNLCSTGAFSQCITVQAYEIKNLMLVVGKFVQSLSLHSQSGALYSAGAPKVNLHMLRGILDCACNVKQKTVNHLHYRWQEQLWIAWG